MNQNKQEMNKPLSKDDKYKIRRSQFYIKQGDVSGG